MTVEGFIFYFMSKQFTCILHWIESIGALVTNEINLISRNISLVAIIRISKNESTIYDFDP